MNFLSSKIKLAVILSLFPLLPFAAEATPQETQTPAQQADSFQEICLSSWLKRVTDVGNQSAYKKFGEKYCACALTQPLDTDAAVDKAIQVCMSRSLLHNTMDSLADEVGLDKATDKDVGRYCQDSWNLIYPKMSDEAKQTAQSFCDCSEPKLVGLLQKSNQLRDKDYYDQIDAVAASCSDSEQSTSTSTPSNQQPSEQPKSTPNP